MFQEIMNRRRMLITLTGIGGIALLWQMVSRGASDAPATPATPDAPIAESTEIVAAISVAELEISCLDNQLVFNPTELVAPAGGAISLTFHNVSTVFMHNWILVDGGEAVVDQVIQEATLSGPAQNYLPADMSHVLANTELVDSGKSATIIFTTPPVGEYTYLCTFPGHCLAGMRGTLTVAAQGIAT